MDELDLKLKLKDFGRLLSKEEREAKIEMFVEMFRKQKTNVIVDLLEARASVSLPMQADKREKIQNFYQYNFLSSIISNLIDKYKINSEEIKEAIRNIKNHVPI